MNLHAEDESGRELNLWQTPTWVSYMCLLNHKNERRKWKDTRHIYLEWVKSNSQGSFASIEESDEIGERVKSQVKEVMDAGKLEFYVM